MLMSMPDQPRHVQPFQMLEAQSMELLCSVAQCRAQQLQFTCKMKQLSSHREHPQQTALKNLINFVSL